jgi:hypothetical protein
MMQIEIQASPKVGPIHVQQIGDLESPDEPESPVAANHNNHHRRRKVENHKTNPSQNPSRSCPDSKQNDSARWKWFLTLLVPIGWVLIISSMIGLSLTCGLDARDTYGYHGGSCILKRLISCTAVKKDIVSCKYRVIFNNGTSHIHLQMTSPQEYRVFNISVPCWVRGNVTNPGANQYDLVETDMVSKYAQSISCLTTGAYVEGGLSILTLICCTVSGIGLCCTSRKRGNDTHATSADSTTDII